MNNKTGSSGKTLKLPRKKAALCLLQTCFAKSVFVIALLAGGVMTASHAQAQGPENTLVVVNEESADSRAIADRYVQLRNIPAVNVVYLRGIRTSKKLGFESSSSKAFRSQILEPILKTMKRRGIEQQIDCIAYSAGFPTRINFQPELAKYLKNTGKKYSIHLHAPWASLTSLTYFHNNVFSDRPDFLELNANRYATASSTKILQNPFEGKEADLYSKAERFIEEKNYSEAGKILFQLGKRHPNQVTVPYALARILALKGDHQKAIEFLSYAQSRGFAYRSLVKRDTAFAALSGKAAFQSVLSKMEDLPEGVLPTRGFSGQSYWSKNGWPCASPQQGEKYLLSTVLALTGKGQSTLQQALAQIERSVAADGTAPAGNVYFAQHKDPRSKTRQAQFKFAAAELESLGRSAKIVGDKYPKNDDRVIGATLGSPTIDWEKTGSKFVPGALCDNLTSYGGLWKKAGQTQLTEFLNAGAAGAAGTVYEPYTIHPKFASARLHAHYARGCTLAEAYYQSVSGPFQLLIVGDPLCCPFGKFPNFEIKGLKDGTSVNGDFKLLIEETSDSSRIDHFEMFFNGVFAKRLDTAQPITVETDTIKSGDHEIRIVAVADSPIATRSSEKLFFTLNQSGR